MSSPQSIKKEYSPYFSKARRSTPSSASIVRTTSSPHFVKSASSTYGSLCQRSKSVIDIVEFPIRHKEDKLVQNHFGTCPKFRTSYYDDNDDSRRRVSPVRHLCENLCYLRAFAPAREWHYLRKAILEFSDELPDRILTGWECTLIPCFVLQGRKPSSRVCFKSPDGKVFTSKASVLRTLGIIDKDVLIRSRVGDNSLALCRKRRRKEASSSSDRISCSKSRGHCLHSPPVDAVNDARSPFGLLEELFAHDPWRLLLSTILLNRTSRVQVDDVLRKFLSEWPTPESVADANWEDISAVIAPLGIRHRRAKGLIRFSREYLSAAIANDCFSLTREQVMALYYCGDYACDAYEIFIKGDLDVLPADHALQDFVEYKRGARH